jgi:MFS family permease
MLPKSEERTGVVERSIAVQSRETQPIPTALRVTRTYGLDAGGQSVVGIINKQFQPLGRIRLSSGNAFQLLLSLASASRVTSLDLGAATAGAACQSMITNTDLQPDKAVVLDESNLGYFGWKVAIAACLGVMGGFGSLFVYTFTVFVKPLGAQFGWNRESVSLGFAIAAMTVGMSSPLIGRLIDRLGPRHIILPCMTVFGCGIASFALLRSGIWQFYLTCFVIGVVGNGAAHLAFARSISTWFERRLGTALAIVMVGAGLGAMILPVVAQAVVTRSGWRSAYLTLGILALLLGLPLSWRYVTDRGATATKNQADEVPRTGMTWQQGTRSIAFWIIVAVLFVSSISMNGAITHLSALLTDRGITAGSAALCASILGGTSIIGRVVTGWLLDRFFGGRVAFVINLATAAGIFMLANANNFAAGAAAATLIGIGAGGEAAITPYLLTRYFGLRAFSTLYGLTWTFYAAAGAAGPVILGRTFDLTGSYTSLLSTLGIALAVAAAMMLLLPKYPAQAVKNQQRAPAAGTAD